MRVKRGFGRAYGASMTSAEKKAMNLEIQRQLAEYDIKHIDELEAMMLWVLHEEFEFGPKRLKRFYDSFQPALDALIKRYDMDEEDRVWLCTHKLKEYGIDLEEWRKEKENSGGEHP